MYADLLQSLALTDVAHGSISIKTIRGKGYTYATTKDGVTRHQQFLGPANDAKTKLQEQQIRQAAEQAKARRLTVTALKTAHIPAPTLPLGRVLEVIANAGLFSKGVVLVGTAAYQTYPCLVGAYLPSSALMTNDADLLVSSFASSEAPLDLEEILRRADPTFKAHMSSNDKLPKVFKSANSFQVDILTKFGRRRKSPVVIDQLKCSAEALAFMDYLSEESIDAAALYGTGILIRVPPPLRYAIHKLLIAQERRRSPAKRAKDLKQAGDLMDVFLKSDRQYFNESLEEACNRGPKWRKNILASLRELKRDSHPTR